jgi:glycosyltransferase involved in cell wall biosynthesis
LEVGVQVLGLEDDLWSKDRERWGAVPASVFSVQGPRFFGYAPGFSSGLEKANPELCHLHSLWMYPGVAMERWSRKNGRPYMVTPNGMLEPWALRNSGWKKRLAGLFYENAMLRGAACLQANTLKEADDFRAYGLKNRIEIVPNGVELPEMGKVEGGNAETLKGEGKKRLLFLGRIHPKKGLAGALRAWAKLRNSPSAISDSAEWQFVIAGWDQGGHEAELRALCADLGLKTAVRTTKDTNIHENIEPQSSARAGVRKSNRRLARRGREWERPNQISRICTDGQQGDAQGTCAGDSEPDLLTSKLADAPVSESLIRSASGPASALDARPSSLVSSAAADVLFYGPAFGKEKEAILRSADAFILPSFSEGLPMSVLEAWAYGLPVVMTPECNLPEGFACDAALQIRSGEGSFQDVIRILIEMTDQERPAMGMRGRRLVEERFTWPKVAQSLKEIYESLL